MLCILCGMNEEFESGICKDCIFDRLEVSASGTLEITECPKCGSLKLGKRWYPDKQEQILAKTVDQMLVLSDSSFAKNIPKESVRVSHDGTFTNVRFSAARQEFAEKDFDVNIPTRRIRNSCPTCNKVTGSYYEAILQIRTIFGHRNELVEKVKSQAVELMKSQNAKDPESFISSMHEVPEGVDIYLGKRADGIRLSKFIMDNYLSSMKVSKSLAGIKDGTRFYRFTYAVRLASLERGSVVSLNDRTLIVSGTSPSWLDAIIAKKNTRARISKSEFFSSTIRVLEKTPQSDTFIVVAREDGEMQLMNKKNYSLITMKGTSDKEEIELFTFDGKYYLPD